MDVGDLRVLVNTGSAESQRFSQGSPYCQCYLSIKKNPRCG